MGYINYKRSSAYILMRNFQILLFLLLVLVSCSKKNPGRPDDVLSKPEMVEILQEIYLKEAKISKLSLPFDSSQALYEKVEKELFLKYDIKDSVYERSMNWYYENPEELQDVYEVLVDSLMVLEKRNQEVIGPQRPDPNDGEIR